MKKLSIGLATLMILNTSFAFAKLTPVEVMEIKVQMSQEKAENDRIERAIEDAALKMQALEDIQTPELGAYYREYGRHALGLTAIASALSVFVYIEAKTSGSYMTSKLNPVIVNGLFATALASAIGATFAKGGDALDRYMKIKTQFLKLKETEQADLYVKLFDEVTELGKELKQSDAKIESLKNDLKNN